MNLAGDDPVKYETIQKMKTGDWLVLIESIVNKRKDK